MPPPLVRHPRRPRPSGPFWWLVASGALAGLATLARVDGLLLRSRRRPPGGSVRRGAVVWGGVPRRGWAPSLVVLAPWLLRDLAVFGAPFPSAGGHTLWITTYNEQFSIGADPSLASYLAWGPPNIVGSKLAAWGELAGPHAVLLGGLFILPSPGGLWSERRRRELAPFIVYFAVMFVAMGLVFTFHAPKGAFYHSAPAVAAVRPAAGGRLAAAPPRRAAGRCLALPAPAGNASVPAGRRPAGAVVLSLAGSAVLLRPVARSARPAGALPRPSSRAAARPPIACWPTTPPPCMR